VCSVDPNDYPPLSHQSSPQRKGRSRKRLGPSSPAHQSTGTKSSVTSILSSAGTAASSDFAEMPLTGRALNYRAPSFVPQGNRFIHTPVGSYDSAVAAARRTEFYRAATEVVAASWEQASLDERSDVGDIMASAYQVRHAAPVKLTLLPSPLSSSTLLPTVTMSLAHPLTARTPLAAK
jgi:hypothetical protein